MSLNSATETVSISAPWSSAGSIGDGYRLAVSGHSSQLTVSRTQNVVTETDFGWLSAVSATVHRTLLLSLTLLPTTDALLVRCLRGLCMGLRRGSAAARSLERAPLRLDEALVPIQRGRAASIVLPRWGRQAQLT